MSDAIISRDNSGWFERLCAEKGVTAASPLTAKELTPSHVLFSATGDVKPIKTIAVGKTAVTVVFTDHQMEKFRLNDSISLIALKGNGQSTES